jgi:peptidoglycan/LPS O-acetylase OafA/YrhL
LTHLAAPTLIDNSPFYFWFSWTAGAAIADAHIKKEPLPFAGTPAILWVALLIAADLFKPLGEFSFTFAALATAAVIARILSSQRYPTANRASERKHIIAEHARFVGKCSYSIYLIHHPVLEAWPRLVRFVWPNVGAYPIVMYVCCLGSWLAILPISWAMYRCVELPAIEMGKRLIGKLRKRRAIAKALCEVA